MAKQLKKNSKRLRCKNCEAFFIDNILGSCVSPLSYFALLLQIALFCIKSALIRAIITKLVH